MNILITGGKNAKVFRLLKAFEKDVIVFGDYDEMPSVSTPAYRFASLGKTNEDSIAHILLDFCLSESIDLVIPTQTFEIEQMAKAHQLFTEYDIEILLPQPEELRFYEKDKDFIIASTILVKRGSLIYSSTDKKEIDVPKNLSGVFELNSENDMNLFLV